MFKDNEQPEDPVENFTVGSKFGRMKKRTLANYCHKETVTLKNAKCSDGTMRLQGCALFDTKSDNLSQALVHSIDTAEQFRSFKELNLLPPLTEISAYEFTCYDAAERAIRKVNDEIAKKASKNKDNPPSDLGQKDPRKTGGFA